MTKNSLLDRIDIPPKNIHRIQGENLPDFEAERYADEIIRQVVITNRWPIFDWIFLGLGDDGHTASIFPGSPLLEEKDSITAIAVHPVSGQQRITLTLPVINHASRITFIIIGDSKKHIVREILEQPNNSSKYPAAKVKPVNGLIEWYLDKSSASGLSSQVLP
jgi:6-phosphogluconolactonase